MENIVLNQSTQKNSLFVPVAGLSLFALASGYLMSLIPLSLTFFELNTSLAPLLASIFYLGLLLGAPCIAPIVARIGHSKAFILFLNILLCSVVAMILIPQSGVWLASRLVAGFAVAGVFVVVESWLLMADTQKQRAKRLGLYMTALYGGTAIGQLAIDYLGTAGNLPYLVIIGLLAAASLPALLVKRGQPIASEQQSMSLSGLKNLSQPAIVGCLVSGLLLGPIYGLLPIYVAIDMALDRQTGLFMALIILGGMLVQPLVSYLSPRVNKSGLIMGFCLLGTAALFLLTQYSNMSLIIGFLLLGASAFALYPIAISLACDDLPASQIVSATQVMLLSYSIGSVIGPLAASGFGQMEYGLLIYLGICCVLTSSYLFAQLVINTKPRFSSL
ncbi:MFS transporter [Shewanella sp. JNE10-2]|uniref:MFS transporter n=1 Tax=unclassified Shewanella TaxID=196818 RepID=UPI002006733E|nr:MULTISPECIES: MFS transporter [unclassified Shewanella]MCK7631475.1 MFS transporter [Shewanella sp. JNE9-1]MCK7634755.1 MFS transporter [Shewanella sp. JNE17]MCK7646779.1 MFS transporter [Shewanella sp. JNE3-1]MCK7649980.1 MFS transporter [Shewanella sp. JNE8]MCK7654735.1 MFS transporter [Shewanella sp. JNE4-1]